MRGHLLRDVPPAAVAGFFAPERPGPLIHAHIVASGVGRCRADHRPEPRTVLAELPGGNVACRGKPVEVPDLAGFVEAPPEWAPALRAVDPHLVEWPRIVAVLPDSADVPLPPSVVRRLGAPDADAVAGLSDPAISWISETWDGPVGLAASGCAWGAFEDGRLVSVAVSFYVGTAHEDIGVVTEEAFRGRGLSTACTAGLIGDVRGRGRRPSWTTSPDNAGSRGVAARLGFVRERDDVLYAVRTPVPAS